MKKTPGASWLDRNTFAISHIGWTKTPHPTNQPALLEGDSLVLLGAVALLFGGSKYVNMLNFEMINGVGEFYSNMFKGHTLLD